MFLEPTFFFQKKSFQVLGGETILPGRLMIRLFKGGKVSQMHFSII